MKTVQKFIAPDFINPIIAWRFWQIFLNDKEELLLRSFRGGSDFWLPLQTLEAKCSPRTRMKNLHLEIAVPAVKCNCGIYGYRDIEYAVNSLKDVPPADTDIFWFYRPNYFCGMVLGRVKLWGILQYHRFMYRAQYAYPSSLIGFVCRICGRHFLQLESFEIGSCRYKNWPGLESPEPPYRQIPLVFICKKCAKGHSSYSFVDVNNDWLIKIEDGDSILKELLQKYSLKIEKPALVL